MPAKALSPTVKPLTARPKVHAAKAAAQPALEPGIAEQARRDPFSLSSQAVLHLQRSIGNRAVSALVDRVQAPVVQPKLTVGPANDRFEREADRMANRVMSAPQQPERQSSVQLVREEEPGLRAKSIAAGAGFETDATFENSLRSAGGNGQRLPV